MKRTFTRAPPHGTENVAKAYNTLTDRTPVKIPLVKAGEGSFGGSSGGMFTCVDDLLKAYRAVMDTITDQFAFGTTSTRGSPIKRAADVFSAKIPMGQHQPTFSESSYAFGIARTQLPGIMGQVGMNPGLMPNRRMPIVAQGTPSRLVFYHQVSICPFLL